MLCVLTFFVINWSRPHFTLIDRCTHSRRPQAAARASTAASRRAPDTAAGISPRRRRRAGADRRGSRRLRGRRGRSRLRRRSGRRGSRWGRWRGPAPRRGRSNWGDWAWNYTEMGYEVNQRGRTIKNHWSIWSLLIADGICMNHEPRRGRINWVDWAWIMKLYRDGAS